MRKYAHSRKVITDSTRIRTHPLSATDGHCRETFRGLRPRFLVLLAAEGYADAVGVLELKLVDRK